MYYETTDCDQFLFSSSIFVTSQPGIIGNYKEIKTKCYNQESQGHDLSMETLSSSNEQLHYTRSNPLETSVTLADSSPKFGLAWRNHHHNHTNTHNNHKSTVNGTNGTIGTNGSANGLSATMPTINNNNHNSKLTNGSSLTSSSDSDDENEFTEKRSRLKKCSSLKTPKTNSTESTNNVKISKKIVRFADVLGLDLERVKTFMDEIPKVPLSAFKDLSLAAETNNTFSSSQLLNSTQSQQAKPSNPSDDRIILPNFHQPFTQTNFYQQLHEKRVMLETAYSDNNSRIIGTVRVVNIGFEKNVYVRYSTDDWMTSDELQASYNASCHDVTTDKFTFSLSMSARLSFAVRYTVNGQEFWDNNGGANYSFNSIPNAMPSFNHVYSQVHW